MSLLTTLLLSTASPQLSGALSGDGSLPTVELGGVTYLKLFVQCSSPAPLQRVNALIGTRAGSVYTAKVPLENLKALLADPAVDVVQPARKLQPVNFSGSSLNVAYRKGVTPDTVTFAGKAGDSVVIAAAPDPSSNFDPTLTLYDSLWGVVAANNDSGPGLGSWIELALPADGTYYAVTDVVAGTGTYELSLYSDVWLTLPDPSFRWAGIGAKVHNARGVTGTGVLAGMVDTGIDFDHPDFINDTTGATRIVYIWDQRLVPQGGESSPVGYGYGVEYDSSWINNTPGLVRVVDNTYGGHGTHVIGTVAGDGSGTDGDEPAGRYAGMAPGASIAVVATSWWDDDIVDGVEWLFSKADFLGYPCVVNLSIGGHAGPHDGAGLFEYALANLISPGRLIVAAAGNSGGDWLHGMLNVSVSDSMEMAYVGGFTYGSLWYDGGDNYLFTVRPAAVSALQDWGYDANLSDNTGGPTSGYAGGVGAWGTGAGGDLSADYRDDLGISLVSPGIDLAGASSPQLVVWHWRECTGQDGGYVGVSDDNGVTWEEIAPLGGYPQSNIFTGHFGGTQGWTPDTFDLSAYAGGAVRVRLLFYSDTLPQTAAGWYIDEVEVFDSASILYVEDFESGNGGWTAVTNDFFTAKRGTNFGMWTGAGANGGGGFFRGDVGDTPFPNNGDYEMAFSLRGAGSPSVDRWWLVCDRVASGGNGQVDSWLYWRSTGANRFYQGGALAGTTTEPGTTPSILTAGAHSAQIDWKDRNWAYEADQWTYDNYTAAAGWSSRGPNRDNVVKPDVTAPGVLVFSSRSFDANSSSWQLTPGEFHKVMSGTSMASPHAAGATALLLQTNPFLSYPWLLNWMHAAARQDSVTGYSLPDSIYGYGKLVLPDSSLYVGAGEGARLGGRGLSLLFQNPSRAPVSFTAVVPREGGQFNAYDVSGRLVYSRDVESGRFVWDGADIQGDRMPSGVYLLSLSAGEELHSAKLILLR